MNHFALTKSTSDDVGDDKYCLMNLVCELLGGYTIG
jgi:hypothetical protein